MRKKEHKIFTVEPGSIADALNIEPGDILVSMNGQFIEDVFDYHFLCSDEPVSYTHLVMIIHPFGF